MPDYFGECYDGPIRAAMSAEEFRNTTCRLCRNQECVNAGLNQSLWVQRMKTQVEKLLVRPAIADPNDPRFDHVRQNVRFEDAMKSAIMLEISASKGDWRIPTSQDALNYVQSMSGQKPPASLSNDPQPPEQLVDEVSVRPMPNVKLPSGGHQQPPRFVGDAPNSPKKDDLPKPSPPPPQVPPSRNPNSVVGPEKRDFVPRAANTKMPPGGLMIGGEPPPAPGPVVPENPWAIKPEPNKPKVIPVGGKIVFKDEGQK